MSIVQLRPGGFRHALVALANQIIRRVGRMSANSHANRRFDIEGVNLGYPALFHDGSASIGMFVVPSKMANDLIADSGFTVAEIAPGRTVLNLACVHYTDTECGVYEEIGCAFFVKKRQTLTVCFFA